MAAVASKRDLISPSTDVPSCYDDHPVVSMGDDSSFFFTFSKYSVSEPAGSSSILAQRIVRVTTIPPLLSDTSNCVDSVALLSCMRRGFYGLFSRREQQQFFGSIDTQKVELSRRIKADMTCDRMWTYIHNNKHEPENILGDSVLRNISDEDLHNMQNIFDTLFSAFPHNPEMIIIESTPKLG